MIDNNKIKKIIKPFIISLVVFIIIFIYLKSKIINSIINILFISFILSYSLKPIINYIRDRFRLSKKTSSIIVILIILFGMVTFVYKFIPNLLRESNSIGNILDGIDKYAMEIAYKMKINDVEFFKKIYIEVSEKLNFFFREISENILDNLITYFESIISLAILPIVTYYFLVDGEVIYNKILLILPTKNRIIIKKIIGNIDKVLSKYIISQLFLSFIVGILTLVTLFFLNVKFFIALAIINGIFNIIPYFGPILGSIPAVIVALIDDPKKGLYTLFFMFLIQQIEGDILAPKITGDCTNMHPIVIIILLLIGEKFGGIMGMIIVVPIGVIIKVIYDDINDYLF
ncbi:AI-2E family transporter [Clostridium sp.]|uniref:AI-2E family transporter n=1 Tax=Clostridium sp. TaxID=1506 RepID=UPI00261344A4|nr:AI-2E family transporter [Clostridium sp.]